MSRTLVLEVPDDLYEAVRQAAARSGRAPEAVVLEGVARHVAPLGTPAPPGVGPDMTEAWARLLRHAGSISSGDRCGSDNERIDADLAREYGAELEDQR